MTKMSIQFSLYMPIKRMCVWIQSEITMGRSLVIELWVLGRLLHPHTLYRRVREKLDRHFGLRPIINSFAHVVSHVQIRCIGMYGKNLTSIFAFDYRYQSSPPYKSRLETKFIVHPPRSRIAYSISCMEIRRHFGFPIDISHVLHTKGVQKPSLSYKLHTHV